MSTGLNDTWEFDETTGYFRQIDDEEPHWLYCPTCDICWTEDRPACPMCATTEDTNE